MKKCKSRLSGDGCIVHDTTGWWQVCGGQVKEIIALIKNDAYASSFQTLGQYRKAILKNVEELLK